jgi:23S rRNA (pseudouridine1915-N3)-methyltransferase
MRIRLLAVGQKMPDWVTEGYQEYAKRLQDDVRLELVEIPAAKRTRNNEAEQWKRQEAEAIQAAIHPSDRVVALDVLGKPWSTENLRDRTAQWLQGGQNVALLVGGPDGLAPELLALASERWSLSPLTLPHPLVRIVVAEQIYRAWTLLKGHPYHR